MKCCVENCDKESRSLGMCQAHYRRLQRGQSLAGSIRPRVYAGGDQERLKSKTVVNDATGCWEWIASLNTNGYGQFRFRETNYPAHRAAWILFRGEIPADKTTAYGTMQVLHRCDNPVCVNPDHLFLGTQTDNINDAVGKNRWGERGCPGESHGRAIVTVDDVRAIRASSESNGVLAKRYGISKSAVLHIKHRRSWKHIK